MASLMRSMRQKLYSRKKPFHFQNSSAYMQIPKYRDGANRLLFWFFIGLLAGTAAANLLYASLNDQAGYYVSLLSHRQELGRERQLVLFGEICRQRVIEVLLAWLIGLTAYAAPCFCLLCGGLGLSVGVSLSVMTGQKGVMGLPFFLSSIMPQALFYIPVWCLLLFWGIKRTGKLRILALLLVLLFVVAGSACEAWLNPWLLGLSG